MARCVLAVLLVITAACGMVRCQDGEAAAVDPTQLVKQWQDYATVINDLLTQEQKKSLELGTKVSELTAQMADLQSKYTAAVSAAQEKDELLKEKNAQLDAAVSGSSKLEAALAAAVSRSSTSQEVCSTRLAAAEESLKYTKAALLKAEEKVKDLGKQSVGVLPPFLAERWSAVETLSVHHWRLHGKPLYHRMQNKTRDVSEKVRVVLDPHLAKAHALATEAAAHLSSASNHAATVIQHHYKTYTPHVHRVWNESLSTLAPHAHRVHKFATHHWESAKVQLAPHAHQLGAAAVEYHAQLEGVVRKVVESHGQGWKPEENVIWYLAATLFALPLLLLGLVFIPFGSLSEKKPTKAASGKPTKSKQPAKQAGSQSHTQRRSRRD